MGKNYWMVVVSRENFEIIKEMGFTLLGFGARYKRRTNRMQPDDRVLFYVTGLRKWPATATITSTSFEDHSKVFHSPNGKEDFPYRVHIAPALVLDEEDYIDALVLGPRLEYVRRWAPEDWHLAFFDALHLLPQRDFRLIEAEMKRVLSRKQRAQRRQRRGRGRRGRDRARKSGAPADGAGD